MNVLQEKAGWVVLAVSVLIGCSLLYYTPRSVQISTNGRSTANNTSEQSDVELPQPIERKPSYEQYLPGTENHPFRPPRRWRSVTPEPPSKPPLPDLQLPAPIFALPTPPSDGRNWSTIHDQIRAADADVTLSAAQFRPLAEQATSSSTDRSSESFDDQFQTFDRIYLKEEEKWVKGTITDESEYFLTFRNHSTGESRQISQDNVKTKPARDPVASLRKEIDNEKPISNLDRLNDLIKRARNLGMMADAASLLESYINNQLPTLSLYRRASRLYQQAGKPEQALRLLNQAVDNQPVDTHELLFLTAQMQWDTGLRTRAVETLQKSIDTHPLFIRARLQQFLYLMKKDEARRAAEKLDKLRMETSGIDESKPKRLLYRFARVYHLWSYGDRARAREAVEQLPMPSDVTDAFSFAWPKAFALRSRLHLERGQLDRAVSVLRGAIEQHPESYALWNNLGVIALALDNSSLADLSFSVCEHLGPYRIQHRLARSNASTNKTSFGAVRTGDNAMPLAYHRAIQSLQPQSETPERSSESTPESSGSEEVESSSGNSTNTGSSSDFGAGSESPAPSGQTREEQNDTSSESSFGENTPDTTDEPADASSSFDTPDSVKEDASNQPGTTGTGSTVNTSPTPAADEDPTPSPLSAFQTVYNENRSFIPGAIGLGYAHVKQGNTATGRSLLLQYGDEHWLSKYVIARSYLQDDRRTRALDYLNQEVETPDDSTGAAYFKILNAYLMLENGRTRQASTTLDAMSEVPDALSDYQSELQSIVRNSQQMRQLTDSFERPGDASSIGGDWTRYTQDSGVSILQESGFISFEGELESAYPFPRIARPTNGNFVSAEFSLEVVEPSEDLLIGVAILNAGSEDATGPIAFGATPFTTTPRLYTVSRSLSHLNNWNELSWPATGMNAGPSVNAEDLTIRLGRSDASADASWYANLAGQKVELNQYAPDLPSDSADLSVVFFASGPSGTPVDLQVKDFRLVHEFSASNNDNEDE